MKKIICICLSILFIICFSFSAFADNNVIYIDTTYNELYNQYYNFLILSNGSNSYLYGIEQMPPSYGESVPNFYVYLDTSDNNYYITVNEYDWEYEQSITIIDLNNPNFDNFIEIPNNTPTLLASGDYKYYYVYNVQYDYNFGIPISYINYGADHYEFHNSTSSVPENISNLNILFIWLKGCVTQLIYAIVHRPLLLLGFGIFVTGAVIALGFRLIRGKK